MVSRSIRLDCVNSIRLKKYPLTPFDSLLIYKPSKGERTFNTSKRGEDGQYQSAELDTGDFVSYCGAWSTAKRLPTDLPLRGPRAPFRKQRRSFAFSHHVGPLFFNADVYVEELKSLVSEWLHFEECEQVITGDCLAAGVGNYDALLAHNPVGPSNDGRSGSGRNSYTSECGHGLASISGTIALDRIFSFFGAPLQSFQWQDQTRGGHPTQAFDVECPDFGGVCLASRALLQAPQQYTSSLSFFKQLQLCNQAANIHSFNRTQLHFFLPC